MYLVILLLASLLSCGCSKNPSAASEATEKGAAAKNIFTNSIGMKLVLIPPGVFMMGSPEQYTFETQHQVRITKPFYIGSMEVSQSQWNKIMDNNPSSNKKDELPVDNISWNEAVDFCNRLSKKENRKYRLPTDAEWEYACRAGTTTLYNTGDTISTDKANYAGDLNVGEKGVYRGTLTPSGFFPPNAWGLYDMHGNVWEWCNDWYAPYPKLPGVNDDPKGPINGEAHVMRGGAMNCNSFLCLSAYRDSGYPNNRTECLGFRVVLERQ